MAYAEGWLSPCGLKGEDDEKDDKDWFKPVQTSSFRSSCQTCFAYYETVLLWVETARVLAN